MSASGEVSLSGTQQFTANVHDALWSVSQPNQLVTDSLGRPVAAKIPDFISAVELSEIMPATEACGVFNHEGVRAANVTPYSRLDQDQRYRGHMPIGRYSGIRYPEQVTWLADIIVRESAGRDDVLATNQGLSDGYVRDAPRHIDNPNLALVERNDGYAGCNMYISLGHATFELALLDDPDALREVDRLETARTIEKQLYDLSDEESIRATARRDLMLGGKYLRWAKAWAKADLRPGDVIFWQGEARLQDNRFPIIHRVITPHHQTGRRRKAVMKPCFNKEELVLEARAKAEAALFAM